MGHTRSLGNTCGTDRRATGREAKRNLAKAGPGSNRHKTLKDLHSQRFPFYPPPVSFPHLFVAALRRKAVEITKNELRRTEPGPAILHREVASDRHGSA